MFSRKVCVSFISGGKTEIKTKQNAIIHQSFTGEKKRRLVESAEF